MLEVMDIKTFFELQSDDFLKSSIEQMEKTLQDFKREETSPESLIALTIIEEKLGKVGREDSEKYLQVFCVKMIICLLYQELCEKEQFRRLYEEV